MSSPKEETLEEYLAGIEEGRGQTIRAVLGVMREELPDATEVVKWGMVVLTVEDKAITGVGAGEELFELYVPQPALYAEFTSKLGKVEAGEDCLRFRKLGDVYEAQLRRLIRLQATA